MTASHRDRHPCYPNDIPLQQFSWKMGYQHADRVLFPALELPLWLCINNGFLLYSNNRTEIFLGQPTEERSTASAVGQQRSRTASCGHAAMAQGTATQTSLRWWQGPDCALGTEACGVHVDGCGLPQGCPSGKQLSEQDACCVHHHQTMGTGVQSSWRPCSQL